ncbi:serine hydrolase domain-containing protein [Kribbella sp. NPDC004536]|uniref:serine hydrolase domain-containing protein n=1 Tax=Kribbella sp. NPDC004536 TaxID=3364106 RepID=UPI0036C5F311
MAAAVRPYAEYALEATGTPGGVLAIGDSTGQVIEIGVGWANLATQTPMSPELTFPGGSLGKLLIGLAATRLADEGQVDLNRPAADYGIDVSNPLGDRAVMLRDLLTHRSGLRVDTFDASFTVDPPSVEQLTEPAARAPEYGGARTRWASPVGQQFEYSSLGLDLVARALSSAIGMPFADYARTELLEPLGIEHTSWPLALPEATSWTPGMTGYMVFGGTAVPTPTVRARTVYGTGIETTASDFTRLLAALLPEVAETGRAPLSPYALQAMTTPHTEVTFFGKPSGMYTGLGIEVRGEGTVMHSYGHAGCYPFGWWSTAWAYPQLDLTVTTVGNAWDMRQYEYLPGCWAWLVAEEISRLRAEGTRGGHSGPSASEIAGVVTAERLFGLLGVTDQLPQHAVEQMARGARPLPHQHRAQWSEDEFSDGLRLLEDAHTSAQIRERLVSRPGLAQYLELVGLSWGARDLLLDPKLGA